jgi:hypothetical protein
MEEQKVPEQAEQVVNPIQENLKVEKVLKSRKKKVPKKADIEEMLNMLLKAKANEILANFKIGNRRSLTQENRNRKIGKIIGAVELILVKKMAKKKLKDLEKERYRQYNISGTNKKEMEKNLRLWRKETIEDGKPIIYSFWKGRDKCLKVGKGEKATRLDNYDRYHDYLKLGNNVRVSSITNWQSLCMAECLATHLYNPRDKEKKPGHQKRQKRCPIHETCDDIRNQLKELLGRSSKRRGGKRK